MRLSVQLYTVRDEFATDPVGTLKQIRGLGVEYVEGGSPFGAATPANGRELLDDLGLKASGSHVPLNKLESELDQVIEEFKTLGCPYVIIPWVDKEYYQDGWDKLARRLENVGRGLAEADLVLCYHNHDFEFRNEGKPGLDQLYEASDAGLVQAEVDVAWVGIGGGNPADYVRKLRGRIPLVHLKDYDMTKSPIWRPGGQGVVDWPSVLEACVSSGVRFGAIELDESPGTPMDALEQSVRFFNANGVS